MIDYRSTAALNPLYDVVKVGDTYTSDISVLGERAWFYISTVVSLDPVSKRFGKNDRIVRVNIITNDGNVVDMNKPIWVSQLLAGLV
jgi:hypothetical protein